MRASLPDAPLVRAARLAAVSLLSSLSFLSLPLGLAAQTTFTVNTTSDTDDGVCDAAHCSLREAILAANLVAGGATIAFDIPGAGPHTILPTSNLPFLLGRIVLDGTTEPDFAGTPVIELDGTNAGGFAQGLNVADSGNVIRGLVVNRFSDVGISIGSESHFNRVEGCYVGTDPSGSVAAGNGNSGVLLGQSWNNTVGGTTAAARNVISGNAAGVAIVDATATANVVLGNYIGTDATGTVAIPNDVGVSLLAPGNTIGGLDPGAGNVISGNRKDGISFGSEIATGNVIQGNRIGTNATGTVALGNGESGISIQQRASDNLIGGTDEGVRNILSGNEFGILIGDTAATGNRIQGNYIGTDVSGAAAIPNATTGVLLWGRRTVIGGTEAGAGNVISGNGFAGIDMGGGSGGVVIQGNYIGTDASGTMALGNDLGIFVNLSDHDTIGGVDAGARNVISGNTGGSITINGVDATGTVVRGNYIGTDVTGTAALGNGRGIQILDAPGNVIGGTGSGARNVVSANMNGVLLLGADATGNVIQGNYFGVDATGAEPMGNRGATIRLSEGAADNVIGGTEAGAGNVVANSGWIGIALFQDAGSGNAIRLNAVFDNAALGLELNRDGVTENDDGDADTGPNELQNYPVLTAVVADGSAAIQATLHSVPSATYDVDFFSDLACDDSGYGEGRTPLGTASLTTDASGDGSVTASFSGVGGTVATATATDANGNTSEFSRCAALAALALSPSPGSRSVAAGQSAAYAIAVAVDDTTFDGTVDLTCSGNPGGTTCTFDDDQVAVAAGQGSATMTVTTVAPALAPPSSTGRRPADPRAWWLAAILALGVLGASSVRRRTRGTRPAPARSFARVAVPGLLAVMILIAAASCGDNGTEPPSGGTAPGSYELTVTAAWASVEASTTVTLVVQ